MRAKRILALLLALLMVLPMGAVQAGEPSPQAHSLKLTTTDAVTHEPIEGVTVQVDNVSIVDTDSEGIAIIDVVGTEQVKLLKDEYYIISLHSSDLAANEIAVPMVQRPTGPRVEHTILDTSDMDNLILSVTALDAGVHDIQLRTFYKRSNGSMLPGSISASLTAGGDGLYTINITEEVTEMIENEDAVELTYFFVMDDADGAYLQYPEDVNTGNLEGAITVSLVDQQGGTEGNLDKTALQAAIAEATAFLDDSEVGYTVGKYPQSAKNALLSVINAASLVEQDADASETEIAEALSSVNTALAAFKAAVYTTNPTTRNVLIAAIDWRSGAQLPDVALKVNGVSYTIVSAAGLYVDVIDGPNDIELSKDGYETSVINAYTVPSDWNGVGFYMNKIRTVNMIVKDSVTKQVIQGATIVVNGESYTTNEEGRISVTTGEGYNDITISKPGYKLSHIYPYHLNDATAYTFELTELNKSSITTELQDATAALTDAVEGDAVGQYQAGAKEELEAAIAAAESAISTATTQAEIDAALQALQDALEEFESKQVQAGDSETLQIAIQDALEFLNNSTVGTNVGEYPTEAEAVLQAVIEAAENLINNAATQQDIDAARQALAAALVEFQASQIQAGDNTVLETKLTEITTFLNASQEGNRAGQYPTGSKAILQAAITAAQNAIDSPASQVQIDNAYALLMIAYDTFRGSVRTTSPRNDDDTPTVVQPQPVVQPPTKITDGMNTVETGQGTVKTTANEVQKIMEAAKPVILESTIATIDFGKKGLNVVELKEGLNASLELGAKVTEKAKTDEVLSSAKLDSAGLTPLGGKVLDLIAQMNYSDGTSKKIKSFAEPVKVTINLKELGLTGDTTNLTAVRFVPQEDGTYKTVKLGGVYNPATNSFEFYTDSFSLYSIVKTDDITKITFTIDSKAYSIGQLTKQTDVPPVVQEQRTLVPIRVVAESLGAKVDWNNDTQTVTITLDGKVLTMTLGQLIEGMDVPAQAMNGRTLVPLRYVSEKLGAYVMWFGEAQRIEIIK